MRILLLALFILTSISSKGQSSYSGTLGKYPITIVMFHYGDGDSRAYYVYNKFDTPIVINGRLENGELSLFEKDNTGKNSATLVFKNFKESDETIYGKWINTDKSKTYPISLKKDFDLDYGDDIVWESRELIQSQSTRNHYFIFQKKTDKLIQTITLDCQLFGIDNVTIGDFNFDGLEDFSVFESSYAGPNTSSIYILRNVNSEKYKVSNFSGTSLEFDNDSKRIYEHNQCCAGRSHMNATYKVVDNKMVLIEQSCIEYDEEQEDFIETDCE